MSLGRLLCGKRSGSSSHLQHDDMDDDGIPNYLDDTDGRPPVDVDVKTLIPFAGK